MKGKFKVGLAGVKDQCIAIAETLKTLLSREAFLYPNSNPGLKSPGLRLKSEFRAKEDSLLKVDRLLLQQ